MGRRLGSALGSFVNVFNPEVIVIGGGWGEAAGELLLEPAREVMLREALSPARARPRRARHARLGGRHRRRGVRRVRGARHASDAARRLRDADRQSRRRHAARARASCARPTSCSARTRACTRVLLDRHGIKARLLSYHEHNEAKRTAELLPRLVAASGWRSSPTPGCRGQRPGRAAGRGGARRGRAGDGAAGAVGGRHRARRLRAWRRALPVPRVPAAVRDGRCASSGPSSRAGRTPSSRSSRRSGCRAPSLARRGDCPTGAVAVAAS